MHIRTYSRTIPKSASRWHHRTINKHKRLNYTGENIHVTEHIYLEIYTYIYIYICIYFYACVCGRGPQTPPFIYSDVLFILSNRSVFLLARWLCHRQQLPGTVLPSPLPTTGPPPSPATHHGTTTVTVSRSEPPHSSTLLK